MFFSVLSDSMLLAYFVWELIRFVIWGGNLKMDSRVQNLGVNPESKIIELQKPEP